MAQKVGYFQNNVVYSEGPFVMCNIGGWRIEAELKGQSCPCACDPSIYELLESQGLQAHKCNDEKKIIASVNWLNEQVKMGTIRNVNNIWKF